MPPSSVNSAKEAVGKFLVEIYQLHGCGSRPIFFATALEEQNYKTIQVDWKPIAGRDKEMQDISALLGGLD